MISSSSFNPSTNTLPITGSTLTLTSTGTQLLVYYDSTHRTEISTGSNGVLNINSVDLYTVNFQAAGVTQATFSVHLLYLSTAFSCVACGNNTPIANRPKFSVYSVPGQSGSGIGDGGATQTVSIVTNDTDRVYFSNTLATFTIPIKVLGAASPVLTTTTTVTSGAGASLGTLTNAPAAGDPTKWIPFNDAGTTRYIPAW